VIATGATTALSAKVSKVAASRTRIALTIAVTQRTRVTAELFTQRGARVSRLVATVRHAARIALRPKHRFAPGRYALRLKLVAGGRTVVKTRTVRVF
jgi:hypothetical protein